MYYSLCGRCNCVTYYTKVVALSMQMLDRKPNDEPMITVEEEAAEYEAEPA